MVSLHASRTGAEADIQGAVRPLGVPALVGRDGGTLSFCGACLLSDGTYPGNGELQLGVPGRISTIRAPQTGLRRNQKDVSVC